MSVTGIWHVNNNKPPLVLTLDEALSLELWTALATSQMIIPFK